MHISSIHIRDFRLFENFTLDLGSGLNVVVGENNSGKTALIDAIRIALDTNSAEWTRISEKDFHTDAVTFSIRLKFENITTDQAYVFVEHLTHVEDENDGRKSVLYVNLIANLTDNLRRGIRFIRTELRSGENAEGPLIEREIREYLAATYLKPLRDAEVELSAGRASRLAQILSSSKKMKKAENFEKLLTDFIIASQEAKVNPGIAANRDSIEDHFRNLTFEDDKEKFKLAVQIIGSKDFAHMSESEKLRTFQDILERLSLTLDERTPLQGLGYNNILFMATELILLEQEAGQFPLLLIEEPEAHLHPQLQMKFLQFIRDEYSGGESPKLQTILSTHSPNLASKAPLDSIILMKNGNAYPMRKGATKLDKDDYVFLEKFLDITKSNLFFAKAVLIVEGDAENILLPTIAKLLGRPLENYGVSIVNVGNTAYARYAKIFLREGMNKKPEKWLPVSVACLRDLDLWPYKADKDLYPEIGFKTVNNRNKKYWIRRINSDGGEFGTDIADKMESLKNFMDEGGDEDSGLEPQNAEESGDEDSGLEPQSAGENGSEDSGLEPQNVVEGGDENSGFEPQNVMVCVSDKWTFEYCLAESDLAPYIYESLKGSTENFDELSEDREEKAIQLYGMIERNSGAKTDVAYKLVSILEREFSSAGKKEEFKKILPQYIVDALRHVTGTWPENLDADTTG